MAYLFTDASGNIKQQNAGSATASTVNLPDGVSIMNNVRPARAKYKGRSYIVGQYNPGIVSTEFRGFHALGIAPPSTIPTLTAGTGSINGTAIGHITFAQEVAGVIIHESAPGGNTSSVNLVGNGRVWSGLPTTAQTARVNKIRGYVSMDGASFRLAWTRDLGVSSVTETVPTLSLGVVSNVNRLPPPYSKYIENFHDRIWYAGNPTYPQRLFFSELGEPESVGAANYFDTRDGEAITGIARCRDYLLVFCKRSTYEIIGYTGSDFELKKLSPNIGCISYGSIVNIDDRLWFASEDGVYVFDGSFKFVMKNLRVFWRDAYLTSATTRANYEDSIAGDDRYRKIYKLLVVQPSTPLSFYYCGSYANFEPELEGTKSQPDWTFDIRARQDSSVGVLANASSQRDEFYTGSCDGYVRKENVASNTDDDGDSYGKALTIRTGHFLYNDPGGGRNHGKNLTDLDIYMESESNAWTLKCFGGDEEAYLALAPMFTATVSASLLSSGGHDYLPKAVHHFRPKTVSGRGFTVEMTASSPAAMEYRGLGGAWKAGKTTRPRKT